MYVRPENPNSLNGIEVAIPETDSSRSAEFFAPHKPYLTDDTYTQFTKTIKEYLGDDCDVIDKKLVRDAIYWLQGVGDSEINLADSDSPETLSTEDYYNLVMNRVIANFVSTGIANYEDHAVLVGAVADIEQLLKNNIHELKLKQQVFARLLENLSTILDSDAIKREVVERKLDSVEAMSHAILESEKVPTLPKRSLFRRTELEQLQQAWETSKSRLTSPDNLPNTDSIVEDYLNGAIAYYQRALYGYRELVLNQGFGSDSTNQVDSYQKRYFEQQDNKYYVAITPREWIDNQIESHITSILYGEESEVAELLNQQRTWSYLRFKERDTGFKTTAGQSRKQHANNYYTPRSGESTPEDKPEEQPAETSLDQETRKLLGEIKELVQKSIPHVNEELLARLLVSYEGTIKSLGSDEPGTYAQPPLKRVLRKAAAELHPDKRHGDSTYDKSDDALSKLATQVMDVFNRKSKADEKLVNPQ